MKALLLAIFAATGFAQSHGVILTWNAYPTAGATFNVYRATGACASNVGPATAVTPGSTFTLLNGTPISALTYGDSGVTGGSTYCYLLSAMAPSQTESFSNPMVGITIPTTIAANPPTGFKGTAH